ncbi:CIC11C00000004199 [Sungouiella intermedia]|uniref:CIC11C00000004199 n=1 Tax=Sungouiella intermedia TaxID=45354 RepID=A0A1L0DKT0_9ASCO|nr:CIC11C00000004199 [[Candida] intermedia]
MIANNTSASEKSGDSPKRSVDPIYRDFVIVDDVPVGDWGLFILNLSVSTMVPIVGFALCLLLAKTHAAKCGALIGCGLLLVLYGASLLPKNVLLEELEQSAEIDKLGQLIDSLIQRITNIFHLNELESSKLPYTIIVIGVLIIVTSSVQFYRVRTKASKFLT